MTARPQVEVIGIKQLRRTLKGAARELEDLRAANAAAAAIVAGAARARTPVKTGRLKSTIRSSGTKTAGVVRAGYKSVPYGGPIHWGWPKRHIAARYFISDPARATEPEWVPLYTRLVDEVLDGVRAK